MTFRVFHDRNGNSALEFALIAPVLFAILGGIVSVSLFAYDGYQFDAAMRDAVREILIEDLREVAPIENKLRASVAAEGLTIDQLTVSIDDLSNAEMVINFDASMDYRAGSWFGHDALFSHNYGGQISMSKITF